MAQLAAPLRRAHVHVTYRTPAGQMGSATREIVTNDLSEALSRVMRGLRSGTTGRGRSKFDGRAVWIQEPMQ